jgi:hypothetical protein
VELSGPSLILNITPTFPVETEENLTRIVQARFLPVVSQIQVRSEVPSANWLGFLEITSQKDVAKKKMALG